MCGPGIPRFGGASVGDTFLPGIGWDRPKATRGGGGCPGDTLIPLADLGGGGSVGDLPPLNDPVIPEIGTCGYGPVAEQYYFDLENDSPDGSCLCSSLNGRWILNLVSPFGCYWLSAPFIFCNGLQYEWVLDFSFSGTLGSLILRRVGLFTGLAQWRTSISVTDHIKPIEYDKVFDSTGCNMVDLITIFPVELPNPIAQGGGSVGDKRLFAFLGGGSVGDYVESEKPFAFLGGGSVGDTDNVLPFAHLGGGCVGDGGWEAPTPEPVSTGLVTCTDSSNNAAAGNLPWGTVNRIRSGVSGSATSTLSGLSPSQDESNYIIANAFNFAVPAGSTIIGVRAVFNGAYSFNSPNISEVILFHSGGAIGSDNKATQAGTFPASPTYGDVEFGGASDLWGASLTPTIVNASSFGVGFRVDAIGIPSATIQYLDFVSVEVFYIEP